MVASAAVEETLLHIAQRDLVAAARENVGDAVAHGARADHSDPLNWHKEMLSFPGSKGCQSNTSQVIARLRFKVRLRFKKISSAVQQF